MLSRKRRLERLDGSTGLGAGLCKILNRGGLRQLGRELRRVRNDLRYDRPASFAFKIMNFIIMNFQPAVVDVRLDRSKRYFSITNGTLASVLHILKCHMLSLRQTWFGARATETRMSSGLKLNWRPGRFELALRSNQWCVIIG